MDDALAQSLAERLHERRIAIREGIRPVGIPTGRASLFPPRRTVARPDKTVSRERIQDEGYLRREGADAAIRALAEAGVPLRRIRQCLGHSRKVVRAVLRGERTNVFRVGQSSLDAYLPWLDAQWDGRG